jgi:hypothetical protein
MAGKVDGSGMGARPQTRNAMMSNYRVGLLPLLFEHCRSLPVRR